MSRLADDIGQLHLIEGTITYSGGAPAVSSNDGSMSSPTDNADGDTTVTWTHEFLSTPTVLVTCLNGSTNAADQYVARLVSVSTTSFRVLTSSVLDIGAQTDVTAADVTVHFTVIGLRNN